MSMAVGAGAKLAQRRNPYRGPREFRREDRLPNRQREARELTDRVVADRVVLLHSPSGAGKTSLIEAAVVRELGAEGFCATPRLRVNQPVPDNRIRNPYIHSVVTHLLASPQGPVLSGDLSLKEAVDRWQQQMPEDGTTVLILDQLEEILILDPTDWDAKETFFRELGMLLNAEPIWALLSMREDYMGGLDRYLCFLPGLLSSRYRLDFLTRRDAKLAMQVPAMEQRVEFKGDAADELVDRLAVVRVQRPGKEPGLERAPYVEPVQLQVVCRLLWKKIRKHRGDDFVTIEVGDVEEYADIDQALTLYFRDTVAGVVDKTGADERKIREWFESDLITKQHFRSQTLNPPDTINANQVLVLLEEGYLIRGDVRGSSTWYELTHDRLIRPVLASNETWRWENLEPWQIAAHEWKIRDRQLAYLLPAKDLPGPLTRRAELAEVEREFLKASENEIFQKGVIARARNALSLLRVLVFTTLFEAVVIVTLIVLMMR
jgi:hypothetical protein